MKRKLIVTLVASALELYAAAATAQTVGSCDIVGTAKAANAATPVLAGPLSPTTGFPEWVQDSTGLTLQRCLDPNLCFFDPVNPDDPLSIQINSGGESFWWASDVFLADPAGRTVFRLGMAAEAAFLQETPEGHLVDGSQFPFLRMRYVFDAPADGTYTLTHPYGTEQFTVTGATGNRDIFTTYDRGLTAGQATTGNVGPFLVGEGFSRQGPFLGNGGDVGALQIRASGGPCFADQDGFHVVTLSGVATDGVTPIDFGGGQTTLITDLFVVQGHVWTGEVQTPINSTRTTYTRTAAGGGQIEAFAGSTVDATVTVVDGPTVPVGAGRIADPVMLDHATVTAADATAPTGINSAAVIVADASAVPPIVTVTASDTATLTTAGTAAFKPSSLNLELVDFVDIAQADFDPATNTLVVSASSGDKRSNPALTVRGLGRIDGTSSLLSLTTAAPPAVVHVDSAAGGTASAQVRVIAAVAPAAPSAPLAGVATSHTVTLSWTDNSGNETGFRIYTVDGAGIRTLRGTAGVNATSGTATGLDANTTYNFVIESYNGVGAASSTEVSGSTLALPATPANASFVPSTSVQNRLDVSWDVVADATEYQVYRGTNGVYPATPTATVTTNSYVDLGRAANTTYSYQVVARRTISGITDSSAPATSNTLTTVSAPTSALIGTASFNATTNVATVNWTDRSNATNNGEWGFQVYRRTGTTGNFAPVGPLQDPSTPVAPATTVSRNYSDTTLTASGTYQYRVDVSNWAGTLSSGTVNLTASIVNLNAPTNLSTVVNSRPTVNWTDNSSGETGHRLLRRQQTVNATTGLVTENTAAPTIRNVAANIQTYREPSALANNLLLRYEVQAYNGGTAALPTNVGASGSAYVMTTGLPAVSGLALTSPNGAGTIRLTWTASTVATVGGYEVQRCEGATCTNFQKVTGTAVNTAGTVDGRSNRTFDDTGLTSGTTYRYRVRTVGGAGTTYFGATFSATVNRVAP